MGFSKYGLLGVSVLLACQFSQAAQFFTYSLPHYPVEEGNCPAVAKAFADKLNHDTQAGIVGQECKTESSSVATIEISYISKIELPLVRIDPAAIGTNGSLGSYATGAACLSDLAPQQALFTSATGLLPFVSYCYKDEKVSDHPFVLKIDALGTAQLLPFQYVEDISSAPVGSTSNIENEIYKNLQSQGVKVAKVTLASDGNSWSPGYWIGISYYAMNEQNWFNPLSYLTFGSPAICEAERAHYSNALKSIGVAPLAFFCSYDPTFFNGEINSLVSPYSSWVTNEALPKNYITYADCNNNRAAVVVNYQAAGGSTPLEAICSQQTENTGTPHPYFIELLFP